jgi:hypothetical protein
MRAGIAWTVAAPPPPPPRQGGQPNIDRVIDQLDLTDDEKQAVDPILKDYHPKELKVREDFLKQMKAALTPEQYAQLESSMNQQGPPPRPHNGGGTSNGRQSATPTTQPAPMKTVKLADGSLQVPVTFTGGYETDPRDGGRPIVLIAAALGVPSDVFRTAFSGVKPARGAEPEEGQVRKNKAALMKVLGPYGVDDDHLNTVSNYYRYASFKGEMWRNRPAVATAHVVNGVVKDFTIIDPGAGYSSTPQVSVAGVDNVNAEVTLSYGTDFKTNGSIKVIRLK